MRPRARVSPCKARPPGISLTRMAEKPKALELVDVAWGAPDIGTLRGVSLTLEEGGSLAVLGSRYSGKSSLLAVAAGILKPDGGDVFIFGADAFEERQALRPLLSYLPDPPALPEEFSAREYLKFVSDVYEVPVSAWMRDRPLAEFAVLPKAHRPIRALDHEERKRLSFVAAILPPVRLYLLDEPWTDLADSLGTAAFKRHLKVLVDDPGKTVLLATGCPSLVEGIVERFAVLREGRIVASGGLDELRRKAGMPEGGLEDVFLAITERTRAGG